MSFEDEYDATVAAMLVSHGKGASGPFGDLPRMLAGEPIVVLGQWTMAVRDYVIAHNRMDAAENVPLSSSADIIENESLLQSIDDSLAQAFANAGSISVDDWMMKAIPTSDPQVRAFGGDLYRPPWQRAQATYGQDIVGKWQQCVNTCARILSSGGGAIARELSDVETIGFWDDLESLALTLDIGSAQIVPSAWDSYLAGMKAVGRVEVNTFEGVAKQGANIAGQALNEVGKTAGAAGNEFLKGFFGDAYPLVIVGGAVYVAIHFGVI